MSERPRIPLLRLDPQLGRLLTADRRRGRATRRCRCSVARVRAAASGRPAATRCSDHLGVLVLDGVVAHDVLLGGSASTELLGPGDVLQPWIGRDAPAAAAHGPLVRAGREPCRAAGPPVRLAARRLAGGQRRADGPPGRARERLATAQAISKLTRVDRRVLAFLWHLAERWGRVTSDGVLVPLTLSHRMLGADRRRSPADGDRGRAPLVDAGEVVRARGRELAADGRRLRALGRRRAEPLVAPRRRMLVTRERPAGAQARRGSGAAAAR